jgi:hypothetical protein
MGNTDPDHPMGKHWIAIYIDANSREKYYDPPHESAYVNFMNKHCLHWTYNTVRVQEEGPLSHPVEGHSAFIQACDWLYIEVALTFFFFFFFFTFFLSFFLFS